MVYVWLENAKRCRDSNLLKCCGVIPTLLVWLLFWDSIPKCFFIFFLMLAIFRGEKNFLAEMC